jgi:hypothetical protein
MDKWPPKLKLISVLATTNYFLSQSKKEGWPDENPEKTAKEIDSMIAHLFEPTHHTLPDYWSILFAPTGAIQEIAIANGWSETYMKLAKEYDGLACLLNDKKSVG